MANVRTCLWFDGDGEEAARFYTSVVSDGEIQYVVPTAEGTPGATPGQALVVGFSLGGQQFQALNGGPQFSFTEAASIVLECATQAEADEYWFKLTEGGSEGRCGWLKDRYGLSWQIVPLPAMRLMSDPEVGVAAVRAMLTMKRIDSEAMARAVGR